ncbi:MAG: hypothetical protein K2I49_03400, partial [Ureaplasma sp.]|nr:hypothetical protein [Ureaplasma sp.]
MYDVDKLIDVTNNLFTFNISSLPYYARMLDFCPWIDELSKEEGDVNTLSSDEKVYTISKFPPVHNQESEWKLETKEVDINGYPFIQAKQTKDGIKIQIPNPYSYSLPDSYKKMFSSDLTLEEKAKIISENAETILDPYFLSFFIDKTSSKIARTNPTQNNPVTLPAGAGGEPIYKNTPYGTLINGGKLEINDPTILHKYSQLTDNLALIDDNVLILNRNGDVSTHYLQNVMQTKQARLDAEIINDTTKPWAVREKVMTRQKFRAMRQRVDVEFDSINKDLNKISSDLRGNAQRIESVNADFKNKANQIKKQLDNGKITVTRHDEMIKSLRTQTNKELANLRTEQLHLKTTQTNLLQKYETDMTELKAFKANMTSRFQKFTKIFSVIGSALSWAMMAFMIWDLIKMFTVQRTPVSYTYDTGDVKLIWDGGWRESRFFGTQVVNSRGIDAGKILDPIQIVRPSKTSGLYYNGTIYPEGADLRFVQTQDILKGKYKPSDIKTVYSFDDVTNQINPNRKYISYSKDELGDRVFDELKIWADSQKTRKNVEKPKFVYEHTWKDGIYEIVQNDFKKTIDNIRKNIRVVQIAYLPKVNESTNFPIFNDTLNEDESIPEYQLPGKTWDSEKNTVIEPSELPKFIVVDPNQPAYSSLDTDEKAINELRNQFQEKFSVPSKTIISSDLNFINKFSELESNIQSSYIYEAQGPRGDVRFFKEESDAIDWIWSSYGIQALYRMSLIYIWRFRRSYAFRYRWS